MNRVALVTGGARGIGLGISRSLAAQGWKLALCGVREPSAAQAALTELAALGAEPIYIQADISQATDRQRLMERVSARFERLDALVNNAGVAPEKREDILDGSEASLDRLMNINVKGPYFLTQLAARMMMKDHIEGTVVFIGSISATVASINRGDYCMSKAAVAMASQLWAVRLAEFGIRVYEVRPGIIRTDMTAGVTAKYDALIEGGLLLQKRWGTPEDVGKAVGMLLKGDLPYSTGQVLNLDGGMGVERL